MSDIGLYGSIYEQLRAYADTFDRALVALRNPRPDIAQGARREIVSLMREGVNRESADPGARFVTAILRQRLTTVARHSVALCESLASTLEERTPSAAKLRTLV